MKNKMRKNYEKKMQKKTTIKRHTSKKVQGIKYIIKLFKPLKYNVSLPTANFSLV